MSEDLEIIRFAYTSLGTFGWLTLTGHDKRFFTVERPWIESADGVIYQAGVPFHSCIPEGIYMFEPFDSPSKGPVYRLSNPSLGVYKDERDKLTRFAIEMHTANTMRDVVGCIGPGDEFGPAGWLQTQIPAVYNSADTLADIQRILGMKQIRLIRIRQYRPFHARGK